MHVPIDSDYFTPVKGSETVGRVGFAGRLTDPRKNVELLVRAAAVTSALPQPLTAVLIGEVTSELRHLIDSLGLGDRIHIVPPTDRATYREWLRSFDVLVIPSHQEGLGIVGLEAMACGCPVVSTRCGGPADFVIDGETGYLVDFDPNQMADASLKIVRDRALRQRLGLAGRELVRRQFTAERAANTFWSAFAGKFPAQEVQRIPPRSPATINEAASLAAGGIGGA
jgi:glycosyltransferase involved in cell wall biosynthesis